VDAGAADDAATPDAGRAADAGSRDAGRDAATSQGDAGPADGVDLTAEELTRDELYYRVTYCNRGTAPSSSTFTVLLVNEGTGTSFESNPLYPYDVPAPGTCATTGGFTCSLVGDPACGSSSIRIRADVDTRDTVDETREDDNSITRTFP
jgi:hypothetical protein